MSVPCSRDLRGHFYPWVEDPQRAPQSIGVSRWVVHEGRTYHFHCLDPPQETVCLPKIMDLLLRIAMKVASPRFLVRQGVSFLRKGKNQYLIDLL